jgi:hypothetical protein
MPKDATNKAKAARHMPYKKMDRALKDTIAMTTITHDIARAKEAAARLGFKRDAASSMKVCRWHFTRDASGAVSFGVAIKVPEMDGKQFQVLCIQAKDPQDKYHGHVIRALIDDQGKWHDVCSIKDYRELEPRTKGSKGFTLFTQTLENYMFMQFLCQYRSIGASGCDGADSASPPDDVEKLRQQVTSMSVSA